MVRCCIGNSKLLIDPFAYLVVIIGEVAPRSDAPLWLPYTLENLFKYPFTFTRNTYGGYYLWLQHVYEGVVLSMWLDDV